MPKSRRSGQEGGLSIGQIDSPDCDLQKKHNSYFIFVSNEPLGILIFILSDKIGGLSKIAIHRGL